MFVARVREVSGFELNQIVPARRRQLPRLPSSIPLIYAKGKRVKPFAPEFAAVSLHQLLDRRLAQCKFRKRDELWGFFGLDPSTAIIASGTAKDPVLERWWQLGASNRAEILKQLTALGIVAITAPNFSVFSDVPRWDNFHDMKRIAICWREILESGMSAALHVNARATRDWERWTDFVRFHTEVDAIGYEFATGAVARFSYHIDELCHLADRIDRPLTLVVRGALPALAQLRRSYAVVSMIDSTTYMRTAKRKFAVVRENGAIAWKDAPDRPAVDMDALTQHNHAMMRAVTGEQRNHD